MKTNIIVALIAGVVLIGGIVWYSQSATTEFEADPVSEEDATESDSDTADSDKFEYLERIETVQFYEDGEHTFVGEIMMPTPCDLLEVDAEVRESAPEQIHLRFEVVNTAEACAQVMTPQRFMVTAEASEEATVTAELMGNEMELNLLEPEPGDTPEDFELFIKG